MNRTALVLVALALCACSPNTSVTPTLASSIVELDLGDGILLSVAGRVTTTSAIDPGCAAAAHDLRTPNGEFQALMITPGCVGTDNTPENGDHGFYPAAPAKATVDRVPTPVGDAVVFENQYSECTSSCYVGTDQVALVTVGNHVVQVIAVTAPASGTTERDRAGLVAVRQGLRKA